MDYVRGTEGSAPHGSLLLCQLCRRAIIGPELRLSIGSSSELWSKDLQLTDDVNQSVRGVPERPQEKVAFESFRSMASARREVHRKAHQIVPKNSHLTSSSWSVGFLPCHEEKSPVTEATQRRL